MPKRRNENAPYWQQMRTAERHMIEFALEHGQTVRGTAKILGVSSNYLGERMRELGIAAPEVRPGPKPGAGKPKPQLQVVGGAAKPPKPPKPPKPAAARAEETLDEDEEDEEWYEDPDEGEGEDEDELDDDGGDGDDDGDEEDEVDDEDADDVEPEPTLSAATDAPEDFDPNETGN